jgi:RNA polymerase sigma-70 factor (ECF subfamily)
MEYAANLAAPAAEQVAETEADLIQAARDDPQALGELCNRYAARLFSYLRARSAGDDEAADLTQAVFVNAIGAFPRYRDRGLPFGAWLFRIAHNVLADSRRRRKTAVSWEEVPEVLLPVAGDSPEDLVLRTEARRRLHALLGDLPAADRDIILLRFVGHLTFHEIAVVVGSSESTVHRQLRRILQTLAEHYHDDE